MDRVGARLLSRLLGQWQLIEELAILRAVYLLGSGDVLHQFTTALFAKLERREPWDDFHELNTMLQVGTQGFGALVMSFAKPSLRWQTVFRSPSVSRRLPTPNLPTGSSTVSLRHRWRELRGVGNVGNLAASKQRAGTKRISLVTSGLCWLRQRILNN